MKNWIVEFPMASDVSTATGWKMKRRPNSAYLAIFLTSAASATDPTASVRRCKRVDILMLSTHMNKHFNSQFDNVYNYLITVRLQNAEGVPPENSQRHSLEQEITHLIYWLVKV